MSVSQHPSHPPGKFPPSTSVSYTSVASVSSLSLMTASKICKAAFFSCALPPFLGLILGLWGEFACLIIGLCGLFAVVTDGEEVVAIAGALFIIIGDGVEKFTYLLIGADDLTTVGADMVRETAGGLMVTFGNITFHGCLLPSHEECIDSL